jgi:hypothetical protein
MGGTGLDGDSTPATPFLAALVIIERDAEERDGPPAARALETLEDADDEPQEIVEEVVEENGAGSSPLPD